MCIEPILVKLIEIPVKACHTSNTENDMYIPDMIDVGFCDLLPFW